MPKLLVPEWTIDGVHVDLDKDIAWSARMVAPGGFERFTGAISEKVARRIGIDQGSPLTGWLSAERVLYAGRVSASPKLKDGKAAITASGFKVIAEKASGRLFWQGRDGSLFVPGQTAPYSYGADNLKFGLEISKTLIAFTVETGVAINNNDKMPAIMWVPGAGGVQPGAGINRFACHVDGNTSFNGYNLEISTGVGPSGNRTNHLIQSLTTLPLDIDTNWVTDDDLFSIVLRRSGGNETAPTRRLELTNIRVNGRTISDVMSPAEMVADIGGLCGYDISGVRTSATNALPQDWQTGSWAEAMTQQQVFDDWTWLVLEDKGKGPLLVFYPWASAPVWSMSMERDADETLENIERDNKVIAKYKTLDGAWAEVGLMASPDPLANKQIVNTYTEELSDPQPDNSLATTVAETLLARRSKQRVRGTLRVARVSRGGASFSPYWARAGELANVRDYRPKVDPQRIVGITYRPDGLADLDIDQDVSAAGVIAKAEALAARSG
jgi:hypothetical protein